MTKKIEIQKLEYDCDSLEPYIDEKTMEIHHDKHYQNYVDKFNALAERNKELDGKTPEEIIADIKNVDEKIRIAVKNQAGGVINHDFFFGGLKKGIKISDKIKIAIEKRFGSFERFREEFSASALNLFGSGWTWLVLNEEKDLEIINTLNQDNPLSIGKIPLLVIDVWEHAYYLKYQNRRAEYIEKFFNVINWIRVNEIYIKNKNG